MAYRFNYQKVAELPKLAWLAIIEKKATTIRVMHGSSVECSKNWMVEGVWDAPFESGDFHRSENFYGSGIRLDAGRVIFATTSSPIDRLIYCEYKNRFFVSNSLVVLLAVTGARLDLDHDYHPEIRVVGRSRTPYDRKFRIIHPEIRCFFQVFHENIIYSNEGVSFEYRYKTHAIKSFEQYIGMFTDMLEKLKQNIESAKRKIPIHMFSTLSQGYDSTAVTSLVKQIGVEKVFSANRLAASLPFIKTVEEMDGAEQIARQLGLELIPLDNRRSHISEDELYYLATTYPKYHSGAWSEVGLHAMATYIEANCSAAVVFSGHHGDSIWKVDLPDEAIEKILIPSRSMGYCSEMRLKSGYISIPLPGFLATAMRDIVAISRSKAMEPWRLHNDYDRPIPRRIAEEAGVDRHLFGMQKKHIATSYMLPINPRLRKVFLKYLKKDFDIRATMIYMKYVLRLVSKAPLCGKLLEGKDSSSSGNGSFFLRKDIDLFFLMCTWATHQLSDQTARVLSGHLEL